MMTLHLNIITRSSIVHCPWYLLNPEDYFDSSEQLVVNFCEKDIVLTLNNMFATYFENAMYEKYTNLQA